MIRNKFREEIKKATEKDKILKDEDRKLIRNFIIIKLKLKEQGIPTAVYYPKPLHLQKCFEYLGYKIGDFPVSEKTAKEIISLPINPYITEVEQEFIVKELKKCL